MEWRCTDATKKRVRVAARRFSAFDTPQTKRTIVRPVRPVENCSRIAHCRVSCERIGQKLLKNLGEQGPPHDLHRRIVLSQQTHRLVKQESRVSSLFVQTAAG